MPSKKVPPGPGDASRGGKRAQEVLRSRGEHPLVANNFWGKATAAQRRQHRLALSARRRAEGACRALSRYQGDSPGSPPSGGEEIEAAGT